MEPIIVHSGIVTDQEFLEEMTENLKYYAKLDDGTEYYHMGAYTDWYGLDVKTLKPLLLQN